MTLTTALTELLGLEHPLVLPPMGGTAGGALAAAVSRAGGLGMVGGGRGGAPDWLRRELALVRAETSRPWGVGFLSWAIGPEDLACALEYEPAAVMLSFGDPVPHAERVRRESDALLIVQVTDLAEARRALDAGADVLVAQGTEAGGHGGRRAALPLVPAVADLAAPVPVLAAGGIADGRGVAAALALGAAGAVIGTRFQASCEALTAPGVGAALVRASGDETERSRVLDIAREAGWPERYTARTLRNGYLDRWRAREDELRGDAAAKAAYREAAGRHDLDVVPVWAGEGVDLITDLRAAAELVSALAAETEAALDRLARLRGAR
ncbi:2-nitropropane dioxygenase [Streptomyces sp. NRRL F-4489]|uniref:NAD(P)H-dependent flavin oxidoreductase n=1 Tax=Streptomyces sp. NRRL F-4489 TaxID=1609095 RepID=UPI000748FA45|nr:nitronate monooxygenase [Streptomyces sp. NRRL F-4489]KUL46051.1 2-nitropropane dioxygenase [Streptomyces sp. NRRL F-4489]